MTTRGAKFAERRSALGMEIGELADAAGIHRDTLSDLEHDVKVPRDATVGKVVRALDAAEKEAGVSAAPVEPVGSSAGMMEFEVTGDFGVRVLVRGPVADHEILAADVARIVRSIREGDQPD